MGTPIIIFGAFDRHNLGDLLFARMAGALLAAYQPRFAGLVARDLSACGGVRVDALRDLARCYAGQPVAVLHAGGEILGCTLAQAAVMLLDRREACSVLARFADAASLQYWAQDWLGLHHPLAYLAPHTMFAPGSRFFYHGIGGVALASLPSALQAEAASELRAADGLWVRDRQTREALAARGVRAHLAPDLVVLAPTLLAAEIAAASQHGEPRDARQRFAAGYIAVQFAAALGDDTTLRHLAAQLDRLQQVTGLGLVLLAAGQAQWHDDIAVYRRLPLRGAAMICQTAQVFELCALLGGCALFCGSSLHARILAEASGRPAVSFAPPGEEEKLVAFLASWESGQCVVSLDQLVQAGVAALHAGASDAMRWHRLARRAMRSFRSLAAMLADSDGC